MTIQIDTSGIYSRETVDLIYRAKKFANKYHGNQLYGDEFPYMMHLQAVDSVLLRFGITDIELRVGAILHDVLEDTQARYEDVVLFFGVRIANMVFAVSEPKGMSRDEAHAITYPRIRLLVDAVTIKLADRIANVEAGGKKLQRYRDEYAYFKKMLYSETDNKNIHFMWAHLDSLLV